MTKRASVSEKTPEREDFKTFNKLFYKTFMKTWDNKLGGVMTESRFYASFSHLKTTDDIKALRDLYKWCEKNKKPFAPICWAKYRMK